MQPIRTAAAYIRVSTEDQLEYSPDSQLRRIREYADRHGIVLPDDYLFLDEGISGRMAQKRPAFLRMIQVAKTKPRPFDAILVWKFSRFARSREDSIVYKSLLRKQCGIDVLSISEQIGEDKTAILMEALLEAMDEYYSMNLAEEVRRGMNERFCRGKAISQPPFGYRMQDGGFCPDPDAAPIVRMMFDECLRGSSALQIARTVNAMGIRTAHGNPFDSRSVTYILSNPTYIGKLRRSPNGRNPKDRFHQSPDTMVVDAQHPPLLDPEQFDAVTQRLFAHQSRQGSYTRPDAADFMLRGLVRCSDCGATLVQAVRGTSLQCHRYAKGQCAISHSVTIPKINAAVLEVLEKDLAHAAFSFDVSPRLPCEESAVALLLAKQAKKLARVREAYAAGVDSLEEYQKNKAEIFRQVAALRALPSDPMQETMPASLTMETAPMLRLLQGDGLCEHAKNRFLRAFIHHITFDRRHATIRIVYHGNPILLPPGPPS